MSPKQIINKYLHEQHVMQLATARNNQPWCASVYYIYDDTGNLYWASIPSRRHSQEITDNERIAVAIAVKSDTDQKVAGIQIEGMAEIMDSPQEIRLIAKKYASRFHRTDQWVEDISSGKTEHCLYVLHPNKYILFDEYTFPADPIHEFSSV